MKSKVFLRYRYRTFDAEEEWACSPSTLHGPPSPQPGGRTSPWSPRRSGCPAPRRAGRQWAGPPPSPGWVGAAGALCWPPRTPRWPGYEPSRPCHLNAGTHSVRYMYRYRFIFVFYVCKTRQNIPNLSIFGINFSIWVQPYSRNILKTRQFYANI